MATETARSSNRSDALVIGLVVAGHWLSHFLAIALTPLFPLIKDDLGVSYAALGFVLAVFFTLSAICQPLAGFLVDRIGGRRMLVAGVGLLTAGTAVYALAGSYAVLVLGAAIAGVGNSVFHPADFAILNSRVGQARLGYAYSAHGMAGSLGFAAAPVFTGGLGVLFGWHAALWAAAGVGLAVFLLLVANGRRLHEGREAAAPKKAASMGDLRVLKSSAVVMCFLYFVITAAASVGMYSFSVTAMTVQYGVTAALASSALTAYMVGSAGGIFAGGFIATRTARHDLVAASGLGASAITMLTVALGLFPAAALPVVLALAGFAVGATAPSRDFIVKASTPPGATGRVYGFVYSGFDVGALIMPVFYGWLVDHGEPQGVFYTIFGLTLVAVLSVTRLPGRRRAPSAQGS